MLAIKEELIEVKIDPEVILSVPSERRSLRLKKEDSDEDYLPRNTPKKRAQLSCSTCGTVFTSRIKLNKHEREHNEKKKKSFVCRICQEVFSNSKSLTKHRADFHKKEPEDLKKYDYTYNEDEKLYKCITCETECETKEEIEEHLEIHVDKYICEICKEKCDDPYKFATHVYKHDREFFRCPICEYKTIRRTNILSHINRMHLKKFTHYCQHCGKGFDDVRIYQEHEQSHSENPPQYECVVCKKNFPFSRYLYSHQVQYHDVTIDGGVYKNRCEVCLKVFVKITSLLNHMKRHAPRTAAREKKHLCEVCGKGFAVPNKLKAHYRTHTGYKPFSCNECSKSFIKKEYLVIHQRVHSGEKPYRCQYCGKCFSQGAPLRIHIRSHTGERPYVCHICQSGFVSKASLNLHLKACIGKD